MSAHNEEGRELIAIFGEGVDAFVDELLGRIPEGPMRRIAILALAAALIDKGGKLTHAEGIPLPHLVEGSVEGWCETYGVQGVVTSHQVCSEKGGGS